MSRYKKGDWVRFKSEEPDIYLSRYAYGDIEIRKRKYIGVIKDVRIIFKGVYNYTILAYPFLFTCFLTLEGDIIEKLTDEQLRNENLGFSKPSDCENTNI